MNLAHIADRYFSLPFIVQTGVSFQYVVYGMIAIYYTILSFPNPLMLSNASIFHGSSVHPISWVFVMLLALYLRFKLPIYNKNLLPNKTLAFIYNFIIINLLVCFAMGLTEFSWDISMTWWWWIHNDLAGLTITNYVLTYAFLLTGSAIGVNILLRNYHYFRHVWLIPIVIFGYELIWLSLGFPITSMPQYHYVLYVNILEVLHWGIGMGIFAVLLK